jgi:hypothetical protein
MRNLAGSFCARLPDLVSREGVLAMRSEKPLTIATGLTSLTIALAPRVANACAVCGLGPNDVGGHAFNSSVLFMMAVPYSTVALIGGAVYLTWRRAQRRRDSSIAGSPKL